MTLLKCSKCSGEVRVHEKIDRPGYLAYKCYGSCGAYKEERRHKSQVVWIAFPEGDK